MLRPSMFPSVYFPLGEIWLVSELFIAVMKKIIVQLVGLQQRRPRSVLWTPMNRAILTNKPWKIKPNSKLHFRVRAPCLYSGLEKPRM